MMGWTEEDLRAYYARIQEPIPAAPVPEEAPDNSSEAMIQGECVKFMEEDGWRPLRTDPVSDKSRGKGFGELGMADYLFLRPMRGLKPERSETLWVEFKSRGGQPKKHQTEWHTKERARGFRTWIASVDFPASVEGFRSHYEKSGLMRRPRWW